MTNPKEYLDKKIEDMESNVIECKLDIANLLISVLRSDSNKDCKFNFMADFENVKKIGKLMVKYEHSEIMLDALNQCREMLEKNCPADELSTL